MSTGGDLDVWGMNIGAIGGECIAKSVGPRYRSMGGWIYADDGAGASSIIGVFIGGEDTKSEGEAGASEFFYPNAHAYITYAHDWPEIFDGVGSNEVKLVGIFLGIQHATPAEVLPE